jgi:D-alanine-D-alanine ligase-like ATP-grasp enzyme
MKYLANKRIRVGIIFGGRSREHEVSLRSARSIMDAIDKDKYEVLPIGITKQGRWIAAGDPLAALVAGGAESTIPAALLGERWEASGISYPDLIDRLLQLALERHADKSRNKTTYDPEAE